MSKNNKDIFSKLFAVIEQRKNQTEIEKSYVASLMAKGEKEMNHKIMEEAQELCEAVLEGKNQKAKKHQIYEICDLLFHTFVLASYKNIELTEIKVELERRFGTSGIEEKKNRK